MHGQALPPLPLHPALPCPAARGPHTLSSLREGEAEKRGARGEGKAWGAGHPIALSLFMIGSNRKIKMCTLLAA